MHNITVVCIVFTGTQTVNVEGDWAPALSTDWNVMSWLFHLFSADKTLRRNWS